MATKGVYEPGSVLKIFNTAMSLESGKVKVADRFDASEPLKLKHNVIKDYRGENRWLSVPEILVYSSNIGSARMALKVGGNEQRNFWKAGIFEPLSIEVAEKASRWSLKMERRNNCDGGFRIRTGGFAPACRQRICRND